MGHATDKSLFRLQRNRRNEWGGGKVGRSRRGSHWKASVSAALPLAVSAAAVLSINQPPGRTPPSLRLVAGRGVWAGVPICNPKSARWPAMQISSQLLASAQEVWGNFRSWSSCSHYCCFLRGRLLAIRSGWKWTHASWDRAMTKTRGA